MKSNDIAELQLASAIVAGCDMSPAGPLTAGQFASRKVGTLWSAYERLTAIGRKVGPLTLREALDAIVKEHGCLASVSLADMTGWISADTSDEDIRDAGSAVITAYRLRSLAGVCRDVMADSARASADPDALGSRLVAHVQSDTEVDDDLISPGEIVEGVIRDWSRRAEAEVAGLPLSIPTGISDLDDSLGGGYEPGSVYVLGARPKMGKTAFAMTSAMAAAEAGTPTLVVSLEMSRLQLGRRIIALRSNADISTLKMPRRETEMNEAMRSYDRVKDLPIRFLVNVTTMTGIRSVARRWWRTHRKTGLIVIDYLQLTSGDDTRNREREIAAISRGVKLLSLELDCATLLLSQLNRGVESRNPPRPVISDLRESGAIEQDADAVLLLYRPSAYKKSNGDPLDSREHHVEVIIAANREGEAATVNVEFIGAHARFQNAR